MQEVESLEGGWGRAAVGGWRAAASARLLSWAYCSAMHTKSNVSLEWCVYRLWEPWKTPQGLNGLEMVGERHIWNCRDLENLQLPLLSLTSSSKSCCLLGWWEEVVNALTKLNSTPSSSGSAGSGSASSAWGTSWGVAKQASLLWGCLLIADLFLPFGHGIVVKLERLGWIWHMYWLIL